MASERGRGADLIAAVVVVVRSGGNDGGSGSLDRSVAWPQVRSRFVRSTVFAVCRQFHPRQRLNRRSLTVVRLRQLADNGDVARTFQMAFIVRL
jgi:hypothetical protein